MPQIAIANPMIQQIDATQLVLTLQPDPPTVGVVHAVLQIQGSHAQDNNRVRYSTAMPSMAMSGPTGVARSEGKGRYEFDLPLQMATRWSVTLQVSGGLNGRVTYNFAVASSASSSSMSSMSSTVSMGPGDPSAWHTATFVLIGVIIIGVIILRRDRRPTTIALVAVVALVVVAVAIAQSRYASPAMDMESMQSVGGVAAVPVTLATVTGNNSGATITAPAIIAPYLAQNIVARAPGLLTAFSVYTGDRLHAGQVVAHLNEPELQSDAQAAAAEAEAAHIEAMHHAPNAVTIAQNDASSARADSDAKAKQNSYWRNELERERALLTEGAVSLREYEDEAAQAATARAAYRASRATLNSALIRVGDAHASVEIAEAQAQGASAIAQSRGIVASYATVTVPDESIVMKRLVDPGVYVQAGTPVLEVAVIDRLRIQAQVAERDLSRVAIGTPMVATVDGGRTLRGIVSSISPVVDPLTHTAMVEALVSNTGGNYQPGGFAHAVLQGRRVHPAALSVPSAAVVGGESTAVWIDEHGTAHRVVVSVLSDDGVTAQVTGAIRPGTKVVVTGAGTLEEGQAIGEPAAP